MPLSIERLGDGGSDPGLSAWEMLCCTIFWCRLEVCLISCSCMQKFTAEPEQQGVREDVSFYFFPLLAELNFKKKPCFNLRFVIPFALSSVRGTPYFIPLLEVCPFFRLSVLCSLACVKRRCRGQGGGDISPNPCTPTHTLFTNCVMAVARRKKERRKGSVACT